MHHTEVHYVKVARTHCSSKLFHVTPMIAKASNFPTPKSDIAFSACAMCAYTCPHSSRWFWGTWWRSLPGSAKSQSCLKGFLGPCHEALAVHILLDPLSTRWSSTIISLYIIVTSFAIIDVFKAIFLICSALEILKCAIFMWLLPLFLISPIYDLRITINLWDCGSHFPNPGLEFVVSRPVFSHLMEIPVRMIHVVSPVGAPYIHLSPGWHGKDGIENEVVSIASIYGDTIAWLNSNIPRAHLRQWSSYWQPCFLGAETTRPGLWWIVVASRWKAWWVD